MRKPARYFSLQRPKLRMSWNKHNLYNLARTVGRDKSLMDRPTFFQMKWDAKARTRAYHGEHIAEKKWKRMFSHRLLSAVDLPPKYLAENDGSEQAAGRGSGLSTSKIGAATYAMVTKSLGGKERFSHPYQRPRKRGPTPEVTLAAHHKDMTPYMQMSFAPLERRLDMAVFRAMFASSVRQARQFIIHGAVEVNGKKMVYPAYQLNPGDMFQVEVEKVLYGTGKQALPQTSKETPDSEADKTRKLRNRVRERSAKWNNTSQDSGKEPALDQFWEEIRQFKLHPKFKELAGLTEGPHAILRRISQLRERVNREGRVSIASAELLEDIKIRIRKVLGDLPADTKLETMVEDFRLLLANRDAAFDDLVEETPEEGLVLSSKTTEPATEESEELEGTEKTAAPKQDKRLDKVASTLTKEQAARFKATLQGEEFRLSNDALRNLADFVRQDEENPYDPSKSYLTPWQPREYMSAFAFIPRYLEVNHDICAAVYLRHPVAKKGMAEVPTPFSYMTNQLAHNWYLQRGPRIRT